jgi:hypothetical protein
MTKRWLLVGPALCSCAIDDRDVRLSGACVEPPIAGMVSSFSAARDRPCPPGICAADLGFSPAVSFDEADISGIVFAYRSAGLTAIALNLIPTLATSDSGPGQALRAHLVASGSPNSAPAHDGFALRFAECVDTSAYSGVSFTTAGDLGGCPMRFAVQFEEGDGGTLSPLCPIDECFAPRSVLVAPGTTTLSFLEKGVGGPTALAGVQWEYSVPTDLAVDCTADFTIEEVRLVGGRR